MDLLRLILSNLDQFRKRFYFVLFFCLLSGIASAATPLMLTEFTKSSFHPTEFKRLIILLVALLLVQLGTEWVIRKYGEAMVSQFPNHLKLKYFKMIESLPMTKLNKHHSAYIMSMVSSATGQTGGVLMEVFWVLPFFIINTILFFYLLVVQSWILAVINLTIFSMFVVISVFMARKMTRLTEEMNERNSVMNQYYADFMSNILTIKRLGIRKFAINRFQGKILQSTGGIQNTQNFHANRWLTLHSIYYVANMLTLAYLLHEISNGRLAPSILVVFIYAFGNMQYGVQRVAENIITFSQAKVYAKNLNKIIKGDDPEYGKLNPKTWQTITLKNVVYKHHGSKTNISVPDFIVNKNEIVCVSGKSGQGKTTILNLLSDFLRHDKGQRFVDKIAYQDLAKEFFEGRVAYISQDVELFNLSVWENLTLGAKYKKLEVKKLLDDLDLTEWFESLKEGFNTIVGEKGVRLSAGQKQRLNLARGILLDKEIYLLDEPTSALDGATEKKTVKALQKYLKGKTVVIVTHRPAIKSICNKFYEIKNGTLLPSQK